MTLLDWIAVIVTMGSGLLGLWRGLTREVLTLCSWGGAFLTAFYAVPLVHPFFASFISNPIISFLAAGGTLFLISLILFLFMSDGLISWVQDGFLRGVDRFLGMGFGILRGFLIICLANWALLVFKPAHHMHPIVQNAMTRSWIAGGTEKLRSYFMSHDFMASVHRLLENKTFKDLLPYLTETSPSTLVTEPSGDVVQDVAQTDEQPSSDPSVPFIKAS